MLYFTILVKAICLTIIRTNLKEEVVDFGSIFMNGINFDKSLLGFGGLKDNHWALVKLHCL